MESAVSEHTWRLSDPGMDLLERAGLAGLFMVLRAASEAPAGDLPTELPEVEMTSDSVRIRWSGSARDAFCKLVEWAWQVREGVLFFPAVHEGASAANWHLRVPMHNGVMRTFLQHPNVQPKLESVSRIVRLDEDKQVSVSFEPPAERIDDLDREKNPKTKRPHKKKVPSSRLRPHEDARKLFDRLGQFLTKPVSLSNWVYPGIAGRYGDESSWDGASHLTLLLMFAPTICLYQRLQGRGNNWIVVVPDVRDLRGFDQVRRRTSLSQEFTDVASLGDAGLRFLAEYQTRDERKDLHIGCRVIAMGYVDYYQGQSIRKAVIDVSDRLNSVRRYRLMHREFGTHFVRLQEAKRDAVDPADKKVAKGRATKRPTIAEAGKSGPEPSGFFKIPTGRGRIADNLVTARPWYSDLSIPLCWDGEELERQRKRNRGVSTERLWFTALSFQRSSLMRLIQEDEMWNSEAEKAFVEACWETIDSLYAQEADAVKRGGSASVEKRFERLEGEIYRKLTQAKTRPLLRAALSELFAKAGRQKTIQAHPKAIWSLLDRPENWRKGRDLALLALASHRKKAVREQSSADTKLVTQE